MTTESAALSASPDTKRHLVEVLLLWLARVREGRSPSARTERDTLPALLTTVGSFVLICATLAAVAVALVLVALTTLTLAGLLISVPFATTLITVFR